MKSALLPCALLCALPRSSATQEERSWIVRAGVVHTAAGAPLENGVIVVEDGKIAAVGSGGSGGTVLEAAAVTPGLIDLSVRIDTGHFSVEQSSETTPELSVAESLDLFSYRWRRELISGVTTVLATPADFDVVGGLGLVLKTGGPPTLEARTLKADAVLRGSLGTQPSSGNNAPRFTEPQTFYYRRPTTRMAVEWVFRKAFYDALQAPEGDGDPLQARRNQVLLRALRGELPLSIQTLATQDVRTAIYLKEEFAIPRVILDAAAECWREPELLVRSGVAVVLPPFPPDGRIEDGFAADSYFLPLDAPRKLSELGVPFALSGHGNRQVGTRLADQAGLAQRGGLPFDAALAAVTSTPARLVGVDQRVGSLEVGKDADLVLWSGEPFEPSSRVIGVLLDGRLVLDPRPAAR
jgi:imidazolonepropionase-like amidohydrolase